MPLSITVSEIAAYWLKMLPLPLVFGAPIRDAAVRYGRQLLVTKKLE